MIQLLFGFMFSFLGSLIAIHSNFTMGLLICFVGVMAFFDALPKYRDKEEKRWKLLMMM